MSHLSKITKLNKKLYSDPTVIKYDTLKEVTLCTCRSKFRCECITGDYGHPDCPCMYTKESGG